jgi:hypothetical protein
MTLFRPHQEQDALAYAAAGGQALHLVALTPARLYDRDVARLVQTVRDLGESAVLVAATGTPRQHVVVSGLALCKACLGARVIDAVALTDILLAARPQGVAS